MKHGNKYKKIDLRLFDLLRKNNVICITPDEIKFIYAHIPGLNQEYLWYWIVESKRNKLYLIEVEYYFDYARLKTIPNIYIEYGITLDDILEKCLEKEYKTNRYIRDQLKNQIDGRQPYGSYIDIKNSILNWFLTDQDLNKLTIEF